ncbi:MAG TPA: winged helix-turn-helix domain-containing protein [Candidatus Omnitrophota bacterium]|jgi:hypothetical protein|nr:winged helix-turn-helix domain-containing protein [Candidatus Omnitrophota bacterium]HSA30617.1 winged helix-turn-helix domain-containing protein [Candidatus Omnitrophota bacterium]
MKDKVIEVAGRTWHELGVKGEASSRQIASALNENEAIVNMALGWLAREDKVRYTQGRSEIMFSLVESELNIFREFYKRSDQKSEKSFWRKLLKRF